MGKEFLSPEGLEAQLKSGAKGGRAAGLRAGGQSSQPIKDKTGLTEDEIIKIVNNYNPSHHSTKTYTYQDAWKAAYIEATLRTPQKEREENRKSANEAKQRSKELQKPRHKRKAQSSSNLQVNSLFKRGRMESEIPVENLNAKPSQKEIPEDEEHYAQILHSFGRLK